MYSAPAPRSKNTLVSSSPCLVVFFQKILDYSFCSELQGPMEHLGSWRSRRCLKNIYSLKSVRKSIHICYLLPFFRLGTFAPTGKEVNEFLHKDRLRLPKYKPLVLLHSNEGNDMESRKRIINIWASKGFLCLQENWKPEKGLEGWRSVLAIFLFLKVCPKRKPKK